MFSFCFRFLKAQNMKPSITSPVARLIGVDENVPVGKLIISFFVTFFVYEAKLS